MAQLSWLLGGGDPSRSPASLTFAPPTSDLDLVRGTSTNLLVVGDDDVVAGIITSLWPSLATPLVVRHRGERLQLSPMPSPVATVVIYDVGTLTRYEQCALYHWIAGNARTQVVSTASKALLPMLRARAFNEALYYRLNVVMLDPTSSVAP